MPIAVGARQQRGPPPMTSEVPGLEALTMIRPGGRHDLRRVSGDEHVAPAAGRHALHRDVGQLLVFHDLAPCVWDSGRLWSRRRTALREASAMPRDIVVFSGHYAMLGTERAAGSGTRA